MGVVQLTTKFTQDMLPYWYNQVWYIMNYVNYDIYYIDTTRYDTLLIIWIMIHIWYIDTIRWLGTSLGEPFKWAYPTFCLFLKYFVVYTGITFVLTLNHYHYFYHYLYHHFFAERHRRRECGIQAHRLFCHRQIWFGISPSSQHKVQTFSKLFDDFSKISDRL